MSEEKKQKKIRKFGIKAKLLAFLIPIVAVAFFALIMIAYSQSKVTIAEKTEHLMKAEGESAAQQIKAWERKNIATLDTAVETMQYLKMDEDQVIAYEGKYLGTYDDFPNGIYISDEKGKILDASGWEPDGDARETTWYQEGQKNTSGFKFGEPYLDALTNEYIVTASCNIENLDGRSAVAAADVSLSILSEVVSAMEIDSEGEAFIIDKNNGIILAHKDLSLVGELASENSDSFYKNIYEDILADNFLKNTYNSANGPYMVSIQNIDETSWYIVTRALEKNIYQDLRQLQMTLYGVGIITLLIICVCMTYLINRITKPIQTMTKTIEMITAGDFTTDVQVSGNDEVTIMARNMQAFLHTMRKVLGSVLGISETIDNQAKNSNHVAGELYDSANGQAEAMGQMLQTLEELVKSITVIAENATTLASVVAETNTSGEQALENIGTTIEVAADGKSSMESVTGSMGDVKDGMTVLGRSISDVGTAAVKIDEITTTIRGIAEETNLLALNASIEAARAGEAGKGFAVVATQIKKLAETSAAAADEISELINSVTGMISETVERSEHSMMQINESADSVYAAADQFNRIYESIEKTNDIVQGMIQQIRNVNDVAANMAAITEEQSASAEEIEATAVSIQQLADTVSENSAGVKNDAKELDITADTLKKHMSRFVIERGTK